jgi:predicted TIM-barrel fold metal-dependent hydrolase
MDIIDAHIHWFGESYTRELAKRAGHENSEEHLRGEYARLGLAGAVVMGNRSLEPHTHEYPDFMRYCIGLDSFSGYTENLNATYDSIEQNLKRRSCVGVKLYPGYNFQYVHDPIYGPVYELAERCAKPVAIHTGVTAMPSAKLKYCHPLTLDEAAADFPRVRFVMCHLGNPWITDAAAVLSKNPNVYADLSGLLEGKPEMPALFREQAGYLGHIRTWLEYAGAYDRLMFGTDWPLVNIEAYIEFISRVIPEKHHENVFANNARRTYGLDF